MTEPAPHFDEREGLRAFLADRDHPCPACGYNLRGLQGVACPECGNPLRLTVGTRPFPVHRLLLAVIPLAFSGILGLLLLMAVVVEAVYWGRLDDEPEMYFWLSVGLICAVACVLLFVRRNAFLLMDANKQRGIAGLVWFMHALALLYVLAQMFG